MDNGERKWRHWREGEARAALAELARTGESATQFARRKGISPQRVAYWTKRLGAKPPFVEVPLTEVRGGPPVEIAGHGVVVRVVEGADVEYVARLIVAIARQSRC